MSEPYWLNRLRWTWRHLRCGLVGHDWISVDPPLPNRPADELLRDPMLRAVHVLEVQAWLLTPPRLECTRCKAVRS